MSSGLSDFQKKNLYYPDGITTVLDPFWVNICRECGEVYWSCDSLGTCPVCGCADAERSLGGLSYDKVAAERRMLNKNQRKSEFIRENQD